MNEEYPVLNNLEKQRTALSVELKQRRQQLLHALPPDTVVLLRAASLVTRSHDTEYPFRQSSDFYYLTGIQEPDAWLMMVSGQKPREYLFVLPRDPEQEVWHGRRLGTEQAGVISAIKHVYGLTDLNPMVLKTLGQYPQLAWSFAAEPAQRENRQRWLDKLSESRKFTPPGTIFNIDTYIHELRLFKSEYEINLMRKSANIAVQAHRRAMQTCQVGHYEYQIAAEIHHQFAVQGTAGPAYGTICGSGENACILHYTENSKRMQQGELLLIDAGCEFQGYASDITRTFPVDGRFSDAQKRIYGWVLRAQQAAIRQIKPGNTLPQAYKIAAQILTEGLIDLGVLQGTVSENMKAVSYRPYFMHGLGHWLGLDVHDVGEYKVDGEPRPLEPGMVLTIEPGLYIPVGTDCDQAYQGVGVRIEDDILVTADGHENLTSGVPVEVSEIESLMQSGTAQDKRRKP